MEVKEAQKATAALEETLVTHIGTFERKTGLSVDEVRLVHAQGMGDRLPVVARVEVEVKL